MVAAIVVPSVVLYGLGGEKYAAQQPEGLYRTTSVVTRAAVIDRQARQAAGARRTSRSFTRNLTTGKPRGRQVCPAKNVGVLEPQPTHDVHTHRPSSQRNPHIRAMGLSTGEKDLVESLSSPGAGPASESGRPPWTSERYRALEQKGYVVDPDMAPPSTGKGSQSEGNSSIKAGVDATRRADGVRVTLKEVIPEDSPHELDITQFFSSEGVCSDSRNHCVPLYDVVQLPGDKPHELMVLPLSRPFNRPSFETYGEAVAFITQIFEGIQFMHERNIAHRDCTRDNIILDSSAMHPDRGKAKYTRTQRPPKYYLTNFSLSRRYDLKEGPPLDEPVRGGDKTAPEHRPPPRRCDPFATDIYYLGNLIRQEFFQRCYGFDFIEPLIADMVQGDPSKRPKIGEVVTRFQAARGSLTTGKLRSRIVGRKEPAVLRFLRACRHLSRTVGYIISGKQAIPDP